MQIKDEMGILKEVSSIASAHGSIALSELLRRKINLKLPNLEAVEPAKLKDKIPLAMPVINVQARIMSGITGTVLLIFEEKSAFELINMCYQENGVDEKVGFTEVGISVIKEIGNIVIGSFVGALSIILKTPIIPSIPTLINGPLQDALGTILSPYETKDYILLIDAFFEEVDHKVQGSLYFVLTPETVKQIQEGCKKLLKSIEDTPDNK